MIITVQSKFKKTIHLNFNMLNCYNNNKCLSSKIHKINKNNHKNKRKVLYHLNKHSNSYNKISKHLYIISNNSNNMKTVSKMIKN